MKPVERSEILDFVTYNEQRDQLRSAALATKSARRVLVGSHLTFLFENRDTVRYQLQELMRTEQIVKEADIAHELRTYNELLGDRGQLGCTLLIGIDDEAERADKLKAWKTLPEHLYVTTLDGRRVRATYDNRQVGEHRLSAVQYLKFEVGLQAPVSVGTDHPALTEETTLSAAQRDALQADLSD